MSVIIRLQKLALAANAQDIRQYFHGLSIPDGGVRIVGGEQGDAFITFSTDEDARQAFNRNYGKIKDVQITLSLSSQAEMTQVIETIRTQALAALKRVPQPAAIPILPAQIPPTTSSLSNLEIKNSSVAISGNKRRRSRSRSRSRERCYDRKEKRRERSRSRSPSRSNEHRNINRRIQDSPVSSGQPHQAKVWDTIHSTIPVEQANAFAALVASNLTSNAQTDITKLAATLAAGVYYHGHLMNGNNVIPHSSSSHINGINSNLSISNKPFNSSSKPKKLFYRHGEPVFNNCVKLSPFYGKEYIIQDFFKSSKISLHINNVYVQKNVNGSLTGLAYVNFDLPDHMERALLKSGEMISNLSVEIESVSDEEFEQIFIREESLSEVANIDSDFTCIKIHVLPNFIRAEDVRVIFKKYCLHSVVIEKRGTLKCAHIKFNYADDARNAFKDTSLHVFQGKKLEVSISTDKEFYFMSKAYGTDPVQYPSLFISITHLPPKCNHSDVSDFFSDIGIVPRKINMIRKISEVNGAVCEFQNINEALLAFQKNGTLFKNRQISMKFMPATVDRKKKSGKNFNMQNQQRQTFSPPNNNMPLPPVTNMNPQNVIANQFKVPLLWHPSPYLLPTNPPSLFESMPIQPLIPPQQRFTGNDFVKNDEYLAPPGCVLHLENVPFNSGVDEILEFLGPCNVTEESVFRKYNDNGKPGGEAKVIFNNPQEAFQLRHKCQGNRIRDRIIKINQI